jgi:hypothetical protein
MLGPAMLVTLGPAMLVTLGPAMLVTLPMETSIEDRPRRRRAKHTVHHAADGDQRRMEYGETSIQD